MRQEETVDLGRKARDRSNVAEVFSVLARDRKEYLAGQTASAHRLLDTRSRWKAYRKTPQRAHREEGEAFGLDSIPSPSDRVCGYGLRTRALFYHGHQRGVATAATADESVVRPA